ncbi:SOS response associated peptidase (SRAP) [Daejeonella rubra]|uniref:Abasic site processing protein n=1 Tax=Daejeonella rubra TaxID=990371 RepID=A0A1G9YUB1_9SPHI|nr:SOS response-associated peptidase family protein [Daejeonella rubra]SDN12769.1 SOS response associated peptidase (SRAP) [Daejeonella rubra]
MAGLWDTWIDKNTVELINRCNIITRPANRDMKDVHDRMPCLLSQDTANIWVNRELSPDERFAAFDPVKDNLLEMKAVNNLGMWTNIKACFDER